MPTTEIVNGVTVVTDTQIYEVAKTSRVSLTVEVGKAQSGGTSYQYGGKTVVGTPNFQKHPVTGGNPTPKATMLFCLTRVADVNPNTNATSVTYTLDGGTQSVSYPYQADAQASRGFVEYRITFVFV